MLSERSMFIDNPACPSVSFFCSWKDSSVKASRRISRCTELPADNDTFSGFKVNSSTGSFLRRLSSAATLLAFWLLLVQATKPGQVSSCLRSSVFGRAANLVSQHRQAFLDLLQEEVVFEVSRSCGIGRARARPYFRVWIWRLQQTSKGNTEIYLCESIASRSITNIDEVPGTTARPLDFKDMSTLVKWTS